MTEFKRIPGTDYVGPADHWMQETCAANPVSPTMNTETLVESIKAASAEMEEKQRQWKEQTEKITCHVCGRRVVVDGNALRVCKCLFELIRSRCQRTGPTSISEPRLTAQVLGLHGIEIRCAP